MSDRADMILKYSTTVDMKNKSIFIDGNSVNGNKFSLTVEKNEDGRADFVGITPLEYYRNKIFMGGEWIYFDKQLENYRYILGDVNKYK